jgi:hypothetical protein
MRIGQLLRRDVIPGEPKAFLHSRRSRRLFRRVDEEHIGHMFV